MREESSDERFQFLWPKLRELKADIVDEHCYDLPKWFFTNNLRYDQYDRNGPKVFMGEYAAQSVEVVSPKNRNTLECALAEAAYMTGQNWCPDCAKRCATAKPWKPSSVDWGLSCCGNIASSATSPINLGQTPSP